ncbi:M16 family metallopeptidase [Flagellimonas zhangzhouensis]|uniref:Predicted Zn-dependent peptidase n=1 Tax=Flagellimonas zhangzhouensis TaxID=1073328 RepID=A0A1H2V204_9FLAO|nr:pitrilysin family protein [Allomuricauda zhangzhouensis]SDQ11649.1 Predicted Zn-dependent peptidase [Allomuricauda zhangzhouensis]SDW62300.1 Predicted Zn-dependent peptidase [Allomuricauda zhangzhouensis]
MKKLLLVLLLGLFCLPITYGQEFQFKADDINIDYKTYTLKNGLTLLVYEDHKAPIAAVNVWYHVGSKNEKPGKSGFAHLFEHLMFNGSENYNTDYFQALESIGGTDLNGTTNNDRTNYFQNVPVSALDQVLFLESDRMGHLLGAIDQERLDEQRGVVQNEKRQGENNPYGMQWDYLTKAMYPKGHPYSWTVIGEMEDLNAASLEDVQEWFKSYYGTANAVVAVAGDVNADEIYDKVVQYFGDIPSGPTVERQEVNIPNKVNDSRQVYQDRVPETRVLFAWNTPQFGAREDLHFDLISAILTSGKNSRLYQKFIYQDQSASSAVSFQASSEIASRFITYLNVKAGEDPAKLEKELWEEIDKFIKEGPTEEELKRVKANYFANFIKGLERIGGFGGVSDILASNQTYHGDAAYYKTQLKFVEDATIADLQKTAAKWLTKGKHILICNPFPEYEIVESSIDRSKLPALAEQKSSKFPELQRTQLSNGLNVVLAQREGVPTVIINLVADAGYKTDYLSSPGTANLAMNLMDEGTKDKTSLEINEQLQLLGASLSTFSSQDESNVYMSTLKPSLDASLDLFMDVLLNPVFPEKEFERLQKEQINNIKQEKAQPITMALRVMNKYLYGDDHPYSTPYTGTGYEESVSKLTRDDVVAFYDTWFKPNNATLIVTGDVEMKDLKFKLEKTLGKWKKGDVPTITFNAPKTNSKNTLYLMNRPESQQSVILAGHLTEKYGDVSEIALEQMVNILGGDFTSRINMNLREDKHWSYGAGGFVLGSKEVRPFIVYAPVQTDKTAESVTEIRKEISEFTSTRPATKEELDKVKTNQVLKLPGQWETNSSVNSSVRSLIRYNLPDDYYQKYDQNVRGLSLDDIRKVSNEVVQPEKVNWFMVGDRAKIIDKLDELGFDNIIEIDADGNPKKPAVAEQVETDIKN